MLLEERKATEVAYLSNKPTIAIVGGSGYIGSWTAYKMLESYNVRVIDIKDPPERIKDHVEFMKTDVREYEALKKALDGVDVVIYTAIIQIPQINEQKQLAYEVNILGLQNACRIVDESDTAKALILSGSWHVFGEHGIEGVIREDFGLRPDKVEPRARLYAINKIGQETIVRIYDEMSEKIFGIIRMGTVLGEGMPKKTAANIFIERGIRGETLTPYKHSMYRPMLYVDVLDIAKAFKAFVDRVFSGDIKKDNKGSLSHIVNVVWHEPITIYDLAVIIKSLIEKHTNGKISPEIEIVDTGQPMVYNEDDKKKLRVDTTKVKELLGIEKLASPEEVLERLILARLKK